MVSLMIVLTVYYFVIDKDHFAFSFVPENEYADVEDMEEEIDIEETELTYENEFFTTTRIELEDQRSVQKERLEEVIKASHVSAEEVKDRKSTRLNSSHVSISYAVFCLKKKKV